MRIAIVSTPFVEVPPRRYGGTELVIHELVEGLAERGHEVTLFATGDSETQAELRFFFTGAQWPPDPLVDLNHVSWALKHARHGAFDLVHAHSAVALALSRLLPARLPMVYTIHHDRNEPLSSFYRSFPDVHYVAISRDQCAREVPLRRTTVVHHGLDPSNYRWSAECEDYVCFVGRFAQVKGPHTAIDAAREAGVPIRVAGEAHPPDMDYWNGEVRPRLDGSGVEFLGAVGLEEKAPLLQGARALLAPIEWNEPFGLILIEAMLSGCPVVAFPMGSVPELVEPGVTGFVVNDEREMSQLIRPGGPLDAFDRQRCRERAEARFGRSRMVDDHEDLYHRVRFGPQRHPGSRFPSPPARDPATDSAADLPPASTVWAPAEAGGRRRRPRTPRRTRAGQPSPRRDDNP